MNLWRWLATASLTSVSLVAAQARNGSVVYEALFQPHSNSTPVFQNQSLISLLSGGNHTLRKRATNDLPAGVCAPGQPCVNGACCSKSGVCSYAPSSCAPANCISNCNATAPCGQYAKSGEGNCPLNVCCSQYGFCGSTDEFCGTGCQSGYGGCGPPPTPSCSKSSASQRTIGYYESWASQRKCDTRNPEDIDVTGLTHLNFAFAFFDPQTFQIGPMDSTSGALYSRFTALKNRKPSLQTWISVGGWSFNDDTNSPNTRKAFSDMVSSAANRATFIKSLTNFMVSYGFDGVDIDWEYPVADDRGGVKADTANFNSLLKEMRAAFGNQYGITATIPSSFWYLQHFDVKTMQYYLDWFNFMSYDIHGTWDSSNRFTGPYIRPHTNLTEISDGLSLLWRAGVDPAKVVLGVGWYGRSFTLSDAACTTPNGVCRFSAGANPGSCTNSAGTLSNAEINRIIARTGVTPVFDQKAGVKWITYDTNQWVSYDDGQTMKLKTNLANSLCLSGLMVWAIDLDTTSGDSMNDLLGIGPANGVSAAQAQAYKNQLNNADLQNSIAASCYWSFCGEQCTSGYFGVTEAKGQVAGIQRNSVCSNGQVQTLCCAPGTTTGACGWEGWRGVGMPCSPVCSDTNATIVARNSNSYGVSLAGQLQDLTCFGGYQAFCCSGFKPSQKTNVGNLFLYGQGIFSNTKRDLALIERRGKGTSIVAGGLTFGLCTAAISAMIAAAPFTFGISLLGIPAEVALCAAAGIAVAATGFSTGGGGKPQTNPNPPKVTTPLTGTPTTNGKGRSSYGQWPILDFGTTTPPTGCDCVVTYTCRYGLGWDEICDNQRWAIDKLLNGRTVFNPRTRGREDDRKYSVWTNARKGEYRTLVQGGRSNRDARCELDEFPMGNLEESGNSNPQACRLVNGPANGNQGRDWNMWKLAQWQPCSAFRVKVCKKPKPPATWKFGPLPGNRGSGSGKRFISAYGFNSQTANSLCFASYTYTDSNNVKQNTMVEDHGFRALPDDPMFGNPYNFPNQNYKKDPGPKASSGNRPTSVNSAAFLKRELFQNFMGAGRNMTSEVMLRTCSSVDGPAHALKSAETDGAEVDAYETIEAEEDELDYHFEDQYGNVMQPDECDFIYNDEIAATMALDAIISSATEPAAWNAMVTGVANDAVSTVTVAASVPRKTIEKGFPMETGS